MDQMQIDREPLSECNHRLSNVEYELELPTQRSPTSFTVRFALAERIHVALQDPILRLLPQVQLCPLPTVENISTLLDNHPRITLEIYNAIHTHNRFDLALQSYLGALPVDIVSSATDTPATQSTLESTAIQISKSLFNHWSTAFQGRGITALQEVIDRNEQLAGNSEVYYSKSISIVQSSGVGKSRLVHEFSRLVFAISFTLRVQKSSGFPAGDPEILAFLTSGSVGEVEAHHRVAALIASSLDFVSGWLGSRNMGVDPGVLAQEWYEEISAPAERNRSPSRVRFCEAVAQKAQAYRAEFLSDQSWVNTVGSEQKSLAEFQSLKIVHRLLMSPIESIITSLGTAHATNKPLMLFIFDEAVNLDLNSRNSNCFVFTALRRLLHVFYSLPLWTIFLSTNSRVGRFASPRRDDSSDRVSQGDLQRFPPFFAFPLDNEAKRRWSDPVLRTTEQAKPVSRFADVDHITMYGRPLWSAYSGQSRARVGAFVEHKLLCGRLDQARTTKRVNQFFALMAARVCLDPVMGQAEAMQLASEAVNSHLRYMVAWDDSIGLLSTVTPDEPIVADAAAAVLMKGGQQVGYIWSDCIQTVASELLSRGLVEKGLKGELYARLMCVLAVDFARHGNVRPDDVQFSYSTTVPTLLFLTRLIGDENFKQLATEPWLTHPRRALRKAATPHNPSPTDPPTLKSLYAEACLTLTHFTFTTSKLPKSPQNTILIVSNLLRRNAGLQLAPYQEHWDLLIPCYLGRPHEPFNIQAVSAILIQVKNTIKPNGKRYFVGEKEVQEYFPTDRPILQILMDLGTGTNSGAVADLATARLGSATGNVRTIIIEGSTARSFGFLAAHIGGKRLEEACQLLMGCLNTQLDQTVHDQILKKVVAGVNCETLLEQL